jgi:hypothetical protein
MSRVPVQALSEQVVGSKDNRQLQKLTVEQKAEPFAGYVSVDIQGYDCSGALVYRVTVVLADGTKPYALYKRFSHFYRFWMQLPESIRKELRLPCKHRKCHATRKKLSGAQLRDRLTGLSAFVNKLVNRKLLISENSFQQRARFFAQKRTVGCSHEHQSADHSARFFVSPLRGKSPNNSKPGLYCPVHPKQRISEASCFGFLGHLELECQFCEVADQRRQVHGEPTRAASPKQSMALSMPSSHPLSAKKGQKSYTLIHPYV